MGDTLTITIPGELRGKGRPRFSTRGGFARAYTDTKTENAEAHVRACAIAQVGQPMLEGALAIVLNVGVIIPKSWPKKRQELARAGLLRPTGKPDFDNLAKLVCDALNKIVWRDDSQIAVASFSKAFSDVPEAVLTVRQVMA